MQATHDRPTTRSRRHPVHSREALARRLAAFGERQLDEVRREIESLFHPLRPSGGAFA